MTISVSRDDDKTAAAQLDHIQVLMFKIIIAAMRQDDKRELIFRGGILWDINLPVHIASVINNDLEILHRHRVKGRLEQRGKYPAEQTHAQ